MSKYLRILAATVLILSAASAADAAAVRSGITTAAISALTRGTAVAYDNVNHVYLVVGAYGVLRGRFVDSAGTILGLPFTIQAVPSADDAHFAHFPRVAFSPQADSGAGAFLVTWHEGSPATPHARLVSFTKNGAVGNDTRLTGDASWWEAGAAVAYSATSQEFLVAYRRIGGRGINNDIRAVRVDLAGAVKGAVIDINNDADYQDNASVAWNSAADEFMVVYAGFNDPGNFAYVEARRVKAGTGALLGNAIRLTNTSGTYITDVTYIASTGKFLASWFALPAAAALGRVIEADGSLTGNIITLSTRWKAYDALSLAHNRRSNTIFMVSHGPGADDGGVEIDANGNPVDNGFVVTGSGGTGNFYPRLAASVDDPNWLVSTANGFTTTMVQLIAGTASADAPAPDPTPAPTPAPSPTPSPTPTTPQPNPKMNADYPAANSAVAANAFLVSGWAIDQGASSGTGVDVVQAWAYAAGSTTPMFIGTATYGIARPDVAGFVGAQFMNCGFTLVGSVPSAGAYDVYVFAHSTLTDTFSNVRGPIRINATNAASNAKMWVDTPSANANTSQNVTVSGWAIDLGASNGTGVDAVHVWAYPTSGGAPVAVGVAQYGIGRADIAAFAGNSRFAGSGFTVTGAVPPGVYDVVAFAHSTVTNTFNNTTQVRITVR